MSYFVDEKIEKNVKKYWQSNKKILYLLVNYIILVTLIFFNKIWNQVTFYQKSYNLNLKFTNQN